MRHLKKIVICLIVALMALSAALTLVACSNVSTGFASQEELARAYFEMRKGELTLELDGNITNINDMLRFYDLSKTPKLHLDSYKQMYEIQVTKIKAEIALKKTGNYELSDINEDGTFKKLSTEDYEKQLGDTKKTADSFVFIEVKKDSDLTKIAQKPNKTIEVWVLKYEYYEYTDGVKADKKTEKELTLSIINVNGKWFANQPFGSALFD